LVSFPEYYPPECTPKAAADAAGEIFRFVKNKPPNAVDFIPQYPPQQDPKESDHSDKAIICQKCGLSIMVRETDVKQALEACPWFRKRMVAKARVNA